MGKEGKLGKQTWSKECSSNVALHWWILPSTDDRNDHGILPYISLLFSSTNGNDDS